ncbi:MAG: hypothetical protein IPL53_22725 [Ignavibacteria bacterium]|nr:hypothetical protein [Ignavibacteria bacterium]
MNKPRFTNYEKKKNNFFCLFSSDSFVNLFTNGYAQVNAKSLEPKLDGVIDSFFVNDSLPGIIVGI